LLDDVTPEQEKQGLLTTVFKDGVLVKETSLQQIRDKLKTYL
jgi:nicotinamide phosphoribosyltransferase